MSLLCLLLVKFLILNKLFVDAFYVNVPLYKLPSENNILILII